MLFDIADHRVGIYFKYVQAQTVQLVKVHSDLNGDFHVRLQHFFHTKTEGTKLMLYVFVCKTPNDTTGYGSFLTPVGIHKL
ncbi:MAG: Uncharacterised protein [Cryomorphaceae bacterium]|nr:MAG: Uncharacterised protein [Cryomorphaceae bacterium]